MAGFADLDEIIESITSLEDVYVTNFTKYGLAVEAASVYHSLWRCAGTPGAGSDGAAGSGTPGAGGTAADQTGLSSHWADTSPATKHLIGMEARGNVGFDLIVYDRLVSVSGVSINSTGTKNVNSVALPRYTDGVGVEVFLEVTTVTASAAVITMNSYTNQAGTGGQVGAASRTFPAAATNVDTMIGPMPLAAGDYGVRSVETISVGTSGGGSAAVNVILVKELARLPVVSNLSNSRDFIQQLATMPRVYDGASLMLAIFSTTTTAPTAWGSIMVAYR